MISAQSDGEAHWLQELKSWKRPPIVPSGRDIHTSHATPPVTTTTMHESGANGEATPDQLGDQAKVAKPPPDYDFYDSWRCIYSGETTAKHKVVRQWWQEYLRNPAMAKYHDLLSQYSLLFAEFSRGSYPIPLHAHVSNALSPTTVASLISTPAPTGLSS
ncbi:hypothetical protein BJY00DRAFT_310278 [Aspergillus carlsbadensis]|nr:hypothetical protein BJY00DRAFT_310278 [Aspergillus carlsbadensis]